MADLAPHLAHAAPSIEAQLPTARQQLSIIAWLRWRMFVNGLKRLNDRAIAARIFGYLLVVILLFSFTVLPVVGVGFAGYFIVAQHHPHGLFILLWAIFLAWHFFAINAATAAIPQFDESSLIRFPLTLPRFLVIKLAASLFGIGFVIACALSISLALGIGLADSTLFPAAAVSLTLFLAFNVLLSRTLQTWINRWLSTRRAREVFAVLFSLFFVSIQFVRLHVVQKELGSLAKHSHGAFSFLFTGPFHSFFAVLPPSLAAEAILSPGIAWQLADFAALLVFIALAAALYVWRVSKQFHGEFLSDSPAAPKPAKRKAESRPITALRATGAVSPLRACLSKEWSVQRRNGALFIQTLMPLAFVVIFSAQGQLLSRHPAYALPGAIGYAMLNALSAGYNLFGAEAAGIQLYLIAPIRIRDVVAAKHIPLAALASLQALLAAAAVLLLGRATASVYVVAATFFWAVFIILINLSYGAFRSLARPVKIDANKVSLSRRNASGSRAGGYLVLAMFLGSLFLCYPVFALCSHFGHLWWSVPIFATLATAAAALYAWMLNRIDASFQHHRETMVEILTKAGA